MFIMMLFERYSRQIATGLVSIDEQKALAKKTAAIVGLGALGSVSAELILRSGVRNLILVDRDFVEESNLQRQQYIEEDIGFPKAEVLKAKLLKIDSKAKISAHAIDLDASNISVLKTADIILDGTDNMNTRFLINDFAKKNKIPWIYTAAIGTLGATMNILSSSGGPCFSCVFGKNTNPAELETCETRGIINSASTAIASLQAVEALKILLRKKGVNKDLVYLEVWSTELKKIKVNKNHSCDTCNGKYPYLLEKPTDTLLICGKDSYQIKPKKKISLELEKFEKRFKDMGASLLPGVLHVSVSGAKVSLFPDGRAIIRGAKTKGHARAIYARVVGE